MAAVAIETSLLGGGVGAGSLLNPRPRFAVGSVTLLQDPRPRVNKIDLSML